MKFISYFSMIILISFVAASCSKGDTTGPIITITSPVEGSTLEKGKSHPFEGMVTDDTELAEIDASGLKITVFDSKTSHVFKNITFPIDSNETNTNGSITVTAKDKEGNSSTKTVNFKIN